jgi:hypothetical protein
MQKGGKICYRCGKPATSDEHVPPKGLFPEQKDINMDLRRNLITVPSCDEHNTRKSDDDEFLLLCLAGSARGNLIGYFHFMTKGRRSISRKHDGFLTQILKDTTFTNLVDKNGNITKAIKGRMNIKRLNKCFESISYGLYYVENQKIFDGQIAVLNGFSEKETKNHESFIQIIEYAFENDKAKHKEKGDNKEVFFYQFTDPDKFGLISLRFCFYGTLHVYAALIPKGSKKPYDLGIDLVNSGIKTIFKLGDKMIEFN